MIGLALEGGGSRGSYQIGVVKAYIENGYTFDGIVGTSIGAINAAILAQNDLDMALNLWSNLSMSQLFEADEKILLEMSEISLGPDFLVNLTKSALKVIKDKGLDTSKMRSVIETHLDEKKIRSSGKDFGLVTVSISERKPYELYLEDIPEGQLVDYIMASACFPGFKSQFIDGKAFIDGGIYNNCPVNLLLNKGYEEIIVVRTKAAGFYRKFTSPNASIKEIHSKENLGSVLLFTKEHLERNMTFGYYDGLRHVKNLLGNDYYINPNLGIDPLFCLLNLEDDVITKAGELMGLPQMPSKRLLFEKILPHLGSYLELKKDFSYTDIMIAILEQAAFKANLEKYKVYDFKEFFDLLKKNSTSFAQAEQHSSIFKDNYLIASHSLALALVNN